MKCYFCNKPEKIIPQKRRLWDGRIVPQCIYCFRCMETGLKTVKERVLYDQSKIHTNSVRGGDRMGKLSNYKTVGDSVSLSTIDGEAFHVTHIEDSDYDDNGEIKKGVKITTKEEFDVDGNKVNKFHTTRIAIVKILSGTKIRTDVNENDDPLGPIKCQKEKGKNGRNFFNLVEA